jgi:hypothetical protein
VSTNIHSGDGIARVLVVIAVHFSAGTARSHPSGLQYRSPVGPRAPDKRNAATYAPEGQLSLVLDSCGLAELVRISRHVATVRCDVSQHCYISSEGGCTHFLSSTVSANVIFRLNTKVISSYS